MEIKLIDKSDKSLELEFVGENETLLNLLKQQLLADDNVANATYLTGHPMLDQPRLHVEVTKGKPETAVKNAAKAVRGHFDEMETLFLRNKD